MDSSRMLYFSLTSFSIMKYSSFVTGFTAQPQDPSNAVGQYIPSLLWCFMMKWFVQSLSSPFSGRLSPNLCHKIASACSLNLQGLRKVRELDSLLLAATVAIIYSTWVLG